MSDAGLIVSLTYPVCLAALFFNILKRPTLVTQSSHMDVMEEGERGGKRGEWIGLRGQR